METRQKQQAAYVAVSVATHVLQQFMDSNMVVSEMAKEFVKSENEPRYKKPRYCKRHGCYGIEVPLESE